MPNKNAPFKRLIYIYVMIKKRGRNGGNALRVAVFFLKENRLLFGANFNQLTAGMQRHLWFDDESC